MRKFCLPVLFALACRAEVAPREHAAKLRIIEGRPIVDDVYLNGHGPFRFLLDTGAQTNQLQASIATALGLKPTFQVDLSTISGTARVRGARVDSVLLGPAAASNQEFLFTTLDRVHTLSPDIQGVLGQEFLSRFAYLLDFANRRIVFGEMAMTAGTRLRTQSIDGCPAIATSEGSLVLDSGADTLVLFRSTTPLAHLRIGNRDYRAQAVAIAQAEGGSNGLIPASLFRAIYFSNSGYVVLEQ